MIRNHIAQLIQSAVQKAQTAGELPAFEIPLIEVTHPSKPEWGDYASPLPLKLASLAKRAPLQIAQAIVKHMLPDPMLGSVEVAPPGFINLTLASEWLAQQVGRLGAAGANIGALDLGAGVRVQVEHVSANPTGPLTIGSARNAAIGDTLARILRAAGYTVETEYYINDAGSQVRHLGASIYARYAQQLGRDEPFPEEGYRGAYVADIARAIIEREGDKYLHLPKDQAIRALKTIGVQMMIESIRRTLARVRVEFDVWFSELSLRESGLLDEVLAKLRAQGLLYEKEDALWFKATAFGLDKDAVLVRSPQIVPEPDERATYLASDLAYVWNKLVLRGYDRAIYVWGADHQGDVPRLLAGVKALGLDPARVTIILYQLVRLTRGGEKVRMSKRAGEFDTLDDLIDDVGPDAVRFLLLTSSAEAAMDFDLQLAVQQSSENPVYYVQYAHARIASILRHAAEQGVSGEGATLTRLTHPAELALIRQLLKLEEVIELAATRLEPHHLPHYALELAGAFHQFYKQCRVLSSDPNDAEITKARLQLVMATKQVLARTLDLMGVSAPEAM